MIIGASIIYIIIFFIISIFLSYVLYNKKEGLVDVPKYIVIILFFLRFLTFFVLFCLLLKPYLIQKIVNNRFKLRTPKHFYVSPFSSLNLEFDFDFALPENLLDIKINEFEGEKKILISSVLGEAKQFNSRRLTWITIKYPLLTFKVMFLIHWHALKLKLKGLKHYPKKDNPQLQKDLIR